MKPIVPRLKPYIYRGDDFVWGFRIKLQSGVYKDFSTFTILSQIRLDEDAANILATFTVVKTTDWVYLTLPASTTRGLQAGEPIGIFDVQTTTPDGQLTRTYIKSQIDCGKDVSRAAQVNVI